MVNIPTRPLHASTKPIFCSLWGKKKVLVWEVTTTKISKHKYCMQHLEYVTQVDNVPFYVAFMF